MGRTFPKRNQKRKEDMLRNVHYLLPVSHFPDYEIFSLCKEYKKDPVRTDVGKFYSVTKKEQG